ncbi:MAG: rhodanese-like domain-containing protein [Epsilonproteobacteria bacterium]|nr:MAG: rhodanese-like domain-containing protein [Campylobacterota bacterium]RLA62698.1 MAG: rhodanese-like domain-containing protein [Campylobacterota bacterium]
MKVLALFLISFNLFATDISVHDLYSVENPIILDVRTASEFKLGHIKYAQNLDAYDRDLNQKLNTLDKDLEYFVICRSGNRSRKVTKKMKKLGFTNYYNIIGGMFAWERAGYPIVD